MPVIRDISLSLKTREVLRRVGFRRDSKVKPEIKSLVLELLASVENTHLLEPAVAYEIHPITEMSHRESSLKSNAVAHGPLLPSLLSEAKELAFVVGTIGPKLEKQVTDYSRSIEPLRGIILDGIGSTAVDSLIPEVLRLVASEVSCRGYEISSPVNPGMPGFPLTEQLNLLGMVDADGIGVRLTASGVLVPRKSTSMVIGIGPKMTRWTEAEVCARCSLRETCHYKVTE